MRVDLFDYDLPEDLIAATPAERRDGSRLLVIDRSTGAVSHRQFLDLPELLREGDLLVMNDARVIPARLRAVRRTGGAVEVLLVRPAAEDETTWLALLRAGGRLQEGEVLQLEGPDAEATLVGKGQDGYWTVQLSPGGIDDALAGGVMPLPPYIVKRRRRLGMAESIPDLDRDRYQTVYARRPGAVAAPTAGLHFTTELLRAIEERGVEVRMLSLLVGPGTFRPGKSEIVEGHPMEAEYVELPGEAAVAVQRAMGEGRRVHGTCTTTCPLPCTATSTPQRTSHGGWTSVSLYPPHVIRAVGALITNFHLPRSTLLMLVSALAGRELILSAYSEAVREGYRFYSYGDATVSA